MRSTSLENGTGRIEAELGTVKAELGTVSPTFGNSRRPLRALKPNSIGTKGASRRSKRARSALRKSYWIAATSLADMPTAFPLVQRHERFGTRRRSHGNYLIFYEIHDGGIEVLHIIHGARDYEALLFPDDE